MRRSRRIVARYPSLIWLPLLCFALGVASAQGPVRLAEPAPASTVEGIVVVRLVGDASAQDVSVLLYEDDRWVFGSTVLPCQYEWDTTVLEEGLHTLRVEVYEAGRLRYRADPVTVQVRRPAPARPFLVPALSPGIGDASAFPAEIVTLPAGRQVPAAPSDASASAGGSKAPATPTVPRPPLAASVPPAGLSSLALSVSSLSGLVVVRAGQGWALHWEGEPTDVSLSWVSSLSRVYAPVRALMSVLGGQVSWEPEGKQVHVLHEGRAAAIQIGQAVARREGEPVELPGPAQLRGERTWLPIRSMEALYAVPVHWTAPASHRL